MDAVSRWAWIPNFLTILRIFLIVPVLVTLLLHHYQWSFYFFLAAGITDGLDGFLARRLNSVSRFGSIADPLADKLLLGGCFILLTWIGQLPLWLLLLMIGRDLWILTGALIYHYGIGPFHFSPTRLSKLNTFCQILLVILMLVELAFSTLNLPHYGLPYMILLVCLTTVASWMDYTWCWGKQAWQATRKTQ